MSQARKTVKVEYLVDTINNSLAQPTLNPYQKQALCFLLENVLMETHNYQGFKYIELYDPELHNSGGPKEYDRKYNKHPRLYMGKMGK